MSCQTIYAVGIVKETQAVEIISYDRDTESWQPKEYFSVILSEHLSHQACEEWLKGNIDIKNSTCLTRVMTQLQKIANSKLEANTESDHNVFVNSGAWSGFRAVINPYDRKCEIVLNTKLIEWDDMLAIHAIVNIMQSKKG